ncbi:hypothetical protein P775_09460 [Puniceibacterium antarcticum]|uniref:Uncharacterized protein n=1 Tax=Puniceibacterium antarcticum TaxID=1206336 RepID=A0A2G8RGB0_9RHOB|nr:hypothetical protein P775_09460 [Puniceibacterium antarcticum]
MAVVVIRNNDKNDKTEAFTKYHPVKAPRLIL